MERHDMLQKKYNDLVTYIQQQGKLAVAFSGGVDSTFLLKTAQEAIGSNVIAITVKSKSFPERERDEALRFCENEGIRQYVVESNELEIEGFVRNPVDRCYICKKAIFGKIIALAAEKGIQAVAEGSNLDDNGDYRPGHRAISELGVLSPLREAQLTKDEIRQLSRQMNLPTWSKPSYACLASRFVYGELITEKKLDMVDRAEQFLLDLGFRQMRVRIHGENLARVEVFPEDFDKVLAHREVITNKLRQVGFAYVTMDLVGYRTGSMNETILNKEL